MTEWNVGFFPRKTVRIRLNRSDWASLDVLHIKSISNRVHFAGSYDRETEKFEPVAFYVGVNIVDGPRTFSIETKAIEIWFRVKTPSIAHKHAANPDWWLSANIPEGATRAVWDRSVGRNKKMVPKRNVFETILCIVLYAITEVHRVSYFNRIGLLGHPSNRNTCSKIVWRFTEPTK